MRSRADDVRKRVMKRKKEREKMTKNIENRSLWLSDEEKHGFERLPSYEVGPNEESHPLFNKEMFLLKILTSACLVLVIAILFRSNAESVDPIKNFVTKSMEQDFQFAAVSEWYEDQFGKPLALLPLETESKKEEVSAPGEPGYALPAAARILEEFDANGKRITIETEKGAPVSAMNEGMVRYVGVEEGFGKTVIIQHADKTETWYGNLETINVSLYEFIEKGSDVGVASNAEDGTKGQFYFALKKGDDFIDPIQVIQFE
ncbi:M23 family metallopeptidase [Bacillus dakarensis]|uniref:M23 family metallopeptidase n=1 Tax=Robertmurraya dakarensis TaxID=1926278 RepID=UPI0009820502|nr:M23 family metallopeptidase [Bacillus dakarensis]